jgi:hypothetical protein
MIQASTFSLGVQAGDGPSSDAVRPHFMALRRLFDATMSGSYSPAIWDFGPVLRIDGALWFWNREGVDNVRVSPKTGVATADIFVPKAIWQAGDPAALRQYLAENVTTAYERIIERMVSKRLECDQERLREDIARVVRAFLAS